MNLREQINSIRIIDDHMHAFNDVYWKEVVGGRPHEFVFDKLELPRKFTPIGRAKSLAAAYRELYGFSHSEISPDNEHELNELYQFSQSDESSVYRRAMEKAGIDCAFEICLSNPNLPPGLDPDRFKRVAHVDGLALPLDNSEIKRAGKQTGRFVSMAEAFAKSVHELLNWYPTSFEDYLRFVSSVIEKLKDDGCIALKLNICYWRDISIEVVSEEEAHDVFQSQDITPHRYKHLQDFLIRRIIAKSAELDLPIQIHTGGIGPERSIREGDPTRLDGFLWLPDLRHAKVVLLHGGYPFCREAGVMVCRMWNQRKTSLDISWMWWGYMGSPKGLVGVLREWLEMGIVRRLVYGSDAGNPYQLWLSAMNFRQCLYLALKGMIEDDLINEDQALTMAELILYSNAKSLYNL